MIFEFECPRGHLLEAEHDQIGQLCDCPHCHLQFYVPDPYDGEGSLIETEEDDFEEIRVHPVEAMSSASEACDEPEIDVTKPTVPDELTIRCPNGHPLATPREMLNEEVICPFCGKQYVAREDRSDEYLRRQQELEELRDYKLGKNWLNFSIMLSVFLILGVLMLVFSLASQ